MSDRINDGLHKPLVVVPGDDPEMIAGSPHLDRLRTVAQVELFDSRPGSDEEKIARVRDADVILNSRGQVTWRGEVLRQLPQLKLIACCAIGTDCIDLPAAGELGITVCNVPGRTAKVVAEHALSLMLAASRRLAFLTSEMKAGRWTQKMSISLAGKQLGVIGTGHIGCEMIRLARAIGMDVVAWSFHPSDEKAASLGFRYVQFDDLLRTSDVVSVHCKLTDDSRGLVGRRQFELMKPGSLLVNTARGPIVDTAALVDALHSEHLSGAAIDVYDQEPVLPDNPLLSCEQVVLTPHSADFLPEGIDALNGGAVDNVLAFLGGNPANVVNV